MKYQIKQQLLFAVALLSTGSAIMAQGMVPADYYGAHVLPSTQSSTIATGGTPLLGTEGSGQQSILGVLFSKASTSLKNDQDFKPFLEKEAAFWAKKEALMQQYPWLKNIEKEHLQLMLEKRDLIAKKQNALKQEYKNFFERMHNYWIDKKAKEMSLVQ